MKSLILSWLCVLALFALPIAGCGDENGGDGGMGGAGGIGGTGGSMGGVFPCTEQGIRDAIAEGGGPQTFDCDGPTTVTTEAEIEIDNDVILDGEGNLTVDGAEDHRVFSVDEGVTAELRGLTATRGNSGTDGGGIYNAGTLTLTDSTVSGNTAGGVERGNGGGILNFFGSGTLTLKNSTVSGNHASFSGGGITNGRDLVLVDSTVSGNTAPSGAGITSGGPLTLTNSTVSGNSADSSGGILNAGPLTLTNSTVSGNSAEGTAGGIGNIGTVTLTNSTVSGNSAGGFGGGGIFNETGGTLTLTNSVVDGDCGRPSGPSPVTSNGHNIESPGNTCGLDQETDKSGVSTVLLDLQPLADNGGPTMTHALGAGSAAINVIPEAACLDADGEPLTTDQRGEPRPGGTMCDVGAFEVQP